MKKVLKIFLIGLGVLFLLLLIAAIVFALEVGDDTDNTIPAVREADLDTETIIQREIVRALDDAGEKDDIAFLLDEYTMNELLYSIVSRLEVPLATPIGAYAAYDEDGALQVEIPVKLAGAVRTCIKAGVKITYTDQVLRIKLENAFVGHFSCTSGIIHALIFNGKNEKNWQNALNDAGICCTLDLDDLTFSTTSAEISETIENLTKEDPNRLLYALLSDLCLNSPDMLEFSFGENQRYGVTVHADVLSYDAATDGTISYPLDIGSAAESTAALIGKGLTSENASSVLHYYAAGYGALSDVEKEAVDALGLPKNNGMGVRSIPALTMVKVLADQASGPIASITNLAPTLIVSERNLNTIFAGLNVIGAGTVFCCGDKIAYVALESVNVTLDDQVLRACIVLNVNGKRLCGYVDTICPDSERMALNAQISELRLGKKVINEARTSLFLRYLNGVLASENWISADAEERILTLDLEAVLSGMNEYKALLKLNSRISMHCRKASQGEVQLVFHLH